MLDYLKAEWENHKRAKKKRAEILARANGLEKVLYYAMLIIPLVLLVALLSSCAPTALPPVSTETVGPSTVEIMQRQIEVSLAQAEAGNFERTLYCVNAITPVYQYPTETARVVEHLEFGQIVSLTLYATNAWLKVEYADGAGYVARASVVECAP